MTEDEAASDATLFDEWLRATGRVRGRSGGRADLSPDDLAVAVDLYVSVGDPVRGAAIRRELLSPVRRASDEP